MADSIFASTVNNMGTVFADKKEPNPTTERALGGYAFYKIYKTKDDRHIVLGGSELHFAEALLKEFGEIGPITTLQTTSWTDPTTCQSLFFKKFFYLKAKTIG